MKKLTILFAILACSAVLAPGAEKKDFAKIDTDALTNETQKSAEPTDGMNIVWWVPSEFWKASAAQDKTLTPDERKQLGEAFDPYVVLAIVRTDINSLGAFRFHNKVSVQRDLRVTYVDAKGVEKALAHSDKVNVSVKNIFGFMRPMLGGAMGEMGKNFHFFVFRNSDSKGKQIVSPYLKGTLVVELKKTPREAGGIIRFECPLNSLHVPRECAKCRKKAHISWNFCPWCGLALPK